MVKKLASYRTQTHGSHIRHLFASTKGQHVKPLGHIPILRYRVQKANLSVASAEEA